MSTSSGEDQGTFDDHSVKCLWCTYTYDLVEQCLAHMHSNHDFDLKPQADFYDTLKYINYCRTLEHPSKIQAGGWDSESFMKPVELDDPLLYFFEDVSDAGSIEPSGDVDQLRLEFEAYKLSVQESLQSRPPKPSSDYYFNSYSQVAIHKEMLQDRVRTDAYRDFIYMNKEMFQDKVVLDAGCGTGILSMFAARAGARKVYAVDASEMADIAAKNVEENGLGQIVQVLKCKLEDIKELDYPIDFIVSEWMGYGLLFEGMLDSVIEVRNRFGGQMLPSRSEVFLAACDDEEFIHDTIYYWSDVYGFKMNAVKELVTQSNSGVKNAIVDFVPAREVISTHALVGAINCNKAQVKNLDFTSEFSIQIQRSATMNSVVVWFDVHFDGNHSITLSTSPLTTTTHWKQTILLLNDPVDVKEGQEVKGSMSFTKNGKNSRDLDITLKIEGQICSFILN